MTPALSVIIPVFNRHALIGYALESVRRASAGLDVEVIVVDDGSVEPVADVINRLGFTPNKLIRQHNQGLLFARLAGFDAAEGRNVLFLDSDDLIGPEKLRLQLAAMAESGAQISYTDTASCTLSGDLDTLLPVPNEPYADVNDGAELCLGVQPAPHAPIFQSDWLRQALANPIVPPSPSYNSVAEIWFYYMAALAPARAVHVPGPHAIIGSHSGGRLTNSWERLGCASLAMAEAFVRACPRTSETLEARRLVAEAAFRSWRKLPKYFNSEFCERSLGVWQALGRPESPSRGGRMFRMLASLTSTEIAGRLLRLWQAVPYDRCRTMSDSDLAQLLRRFPRVLDS